MVQDPFAEPDNPFADPIPVAASNPPFAQSARPKVLTRLQAGVNFNADGVDFVSVDVADVYAPKGVVCEKGVVPKCLGKRGMDVGGCLFCGREVVRGVRAKFEEGVAAGTQKQQEEGGGAGEQLAMAAATVQESSKGKEPSTQRPKEKNLLKRGVASVKLLFGPRAKRPKSSAGYVAIDDVDGAVKKPKKPKRVVEPARYANGEVVRPLFYGP